MSLYFALIAPLSTSVATDDSLTVAMSILRWAQQNTLLSLRLHYAFSAVWASCLATATALIVHRIPYYLRLPLFLTPVHHCVIGVISRLSIPIGIYIVRWFRY